MRLRLLDALLRMLLYSRTEDQDNVDKEDDQVHRPLEDGCARSGESERAEHEGESEKSHAGRAKTQDHGFACCETDAENRWHGEANG